MTVTVVSQSGPRIPNGSFYTADDLSTLRAIVDANAAFAAQQLGGSPGMYQCMAPFSLGRDVCWPGVDSSPDTAYIAIAYTGGFCETVDKPAVHVSDFKLDLTVTYHSVPNCRINGVMALPTAALLSFSTAALKAGLYSLDYIFLRDNDTYTSADTYLSVPGPVPTDQRATEAAALDALQRTIDSTTGGVFSESRVDGAQLQALCSETPAGPQFLVTFAASATRQMQVMLATAPPHQCVSTPI